MAEFKKLFTAEAYKQSLLYDIYNLKTNYSNKVDQNTKTYYNCGYRGMTAYSMDCWNWHKIKWWGWVPGYNVGSFLYAPGTNGIGDWTGRQILDKCADVSKDFKKIVPVEWLLTAAEDHAGVWIGKQMWNGYEFNTAECTPKIVRNGQLVMSAGCHLSYTDEQGRRFNHKGGVQVGSWAYHGKLPWIDYSANELSYTVTTEGNKTYLDVDGKGRFEISTTTIVKKI